MTDPILLALSMLLFLQFCLELELLSIEVGVRVEHLASFFKNADDTNIICERSFLSYPKYLGSRHRLSCQWNHRQDLANVIGHMTCLESCVTCLDSECIH